MIILSGIIWTNCLSLDMISTIWITSVHILSYYTDANFNTIMGLFEQADTRFTYMIIYPKKYLHNCSVAETIWTHLIDSFLTNTAQNVGRQELLFANRKENHRSASFLQNARGFHAFHEKEISKDQEDQISGHSTGETEIRWVAAVPYAFDY